MNWKTGENNPFCYRKINPERSFDRTLIERLIRKEIEKKAYPQFILDKGNFCFTKEKPIMTKELNIFPSIHLVVTVEATGKIVIGFEYKHQFEFNRFIVDNSNKNAYEYIFKEVAPYKAGDVSPYLGESIISYYLRTEQFAKLKGISEELPVVHVKNKYGEVLSYLPQLLKLCCSLEQIPNHLKNVVKQ